MKVMRVVSRCVFEIEQNQSLHVQKSRNCTGLVNHEVEVTWRCRFMSRTKFSDMIEKSFKVVLFLILVRYYLQRLTIYI